MSMAAATIALTVVAVAMLTMSMGIDIGLPPSGSIDDRPSLAPTQ
jgi:hypothetical protein